MEETNNPNVNKMIIPINKPPVFNEKEIRNRFVARVYSILACQLLFTAIMIAWFIFEPNTKQFMREHPLPFIIGGILLYMIPFMLLICIEQLRRSYPINFVLLAMGTIGMSITVAVTCTVYDTQVVLWAFAATLLSVVLISLLAAYSPIDITNCGAVLYIIGMVHLVVGGIAAAILLPTKHASTLSLVLGIFGALIFSLYLYYDTQLILGGRNQEIGAEDYILGAISLYLDIINMFLNILAIIGSGSGGSGS